MEFVVVRFYFIITYIFFYYTSLILEDDLHLHGVLIIHIHVHHQGAAHQFTEVENLVQDLILEENTRITIYAKQLCITFL